MLNYINSDINWLKAVSIWQKKKKSSNESMFYVLLNKISEQLKFWSFIHPQSNFIPKNLIVKVIKTEIPI